VNSVSVKYQTFQVF